MFALIASCYVLSGPHVRALELRIFGAPQWYARSQQLEGQVAPDFTAEDLGGSEFKLSDHKGKVILIERWRSWCPPCLEQFPYLAHAHAELADEGLVVVTLNSEPADLQTRFQRELSLPFHMLREPVGLPGAYGGDDRFPQTFLVGRDGRFATVDVAGGYYLLRELMREVRGSDWDGASNPIAPLPPNGAPVARE